MKDTFERYQINIGGYISFLILILRGLKPVYNPKLKGLTSTQCYLTKGNTIDTIPITNPLSLFIFFSNNERGFVTQQRYILLLLYYYIKLFYVCSEGSH